MAKRHWLKFRILLRYTVGSPQNLEPIHILGEVQVENDKAKTFSELTKMAIEKFLDKQPYLQQIIEIGGAEVWAERV